MTNTNTNEIDAWNREAKGFEFEYRDARGTLWECSADFIYESASEDQGDDFRLEQLLDIRARRNDGPYIEVAPDDGMLAALRREIDGSRLIYEAEELAIAEGRDEYVPEHDEQ